MKNQEVAEIFAAMGDILAVQGESTHRIMAYRRAAENIAALGRPLEEVEEEVLRATDELQLLEGPGKRPGDDVAVRLSTEGIDLIHVEGEALHGNVDLVQAIPVGEGRVLHLADDAGLDVREHAAPFVDVRSEPVAIALDRNGRRGMYG